MNRTEFENMWRKSLDERWRNALCTVEDTDRRINVDEFIRASSGEMMELAWRHYCLAKDIAKVGEREALLC
jgi:hypothetical protein